MEAVLENDVQEEQMECTETPAEEVKQIKPAAIEVVPAIRRYENKAGGFVTGVDLLSKDSQEKISERARRFGIGDDQHPITESDVKILYESLGIDVAEKMNKFRLDTIHLRGTDKMSTEDVFLYFNEYGASAVEWINDSTCNVLWTETSGAARTMLGMSRPILRKTKNTADPDDENKTEQEDTDNVVFMQSSDEEEETTDNKIDLPAKDGEEIPVISLKSSHHKIVELDVSKLKVPIPPGRWRIGKAFSKAKLLLMRFAARTDRKVPGAEKLSQYYQVHGNPNFGGLRGKISSSLKNRKTLERNKRPTRPLQRRDSNPPSSSPSPVNSSGSEDEADKMTSRSRAPRMRMYADEEESNMAKRAAEVSALASSANPSRRSVRPDLREKISGRVQSFVPDRTQKSSDLRNKLSDRRPSIRIRSTVITSRTSSRSNSRSKSRSRSPLSRSDSDDSEKSSSDLRDKLDRLRKNKLSKSHRSPLVIQVSQEDSD